MTCRWAQDRTGLLTFPQLNPLCPAAQPTSPPAAALLPEQWVELMHGFMDMKINTSKGQGRERFMRPYCSATLISGIWDKSFIYYKSSESLRVLLNYYIRRTVRGIDGERVFDLVSTSVHVWGGEAIAWPFLIRQLTFQERWIKRRRDLLSLISQGLHADLRQRYEDWWKPLFFGYYAL